MNPERPHAPGQKLFHRLAWIRAQRINDRRAHEPVGIELDHIKHVAIIEPIKDHLDQVDPAHSRRPALRQQLLGRERRRLHVRFRESRRERIMGDVGRPDVRVRVDVRLHGGLPSLGETTTSKNQSQPAAGKISVPFGPCLLRVGHYGFPV